MFKVKSSVDSILYYSFKAVKLDAGGYLVYVSNITSRVLSGNALSKALNEKEMLIKEVHHRVKNNMQIIAGLLEMQESTLDSKGASFFRKSH